MTYMKQGVGVQNLTHCICIKACEYKHVRVVHAARCSSTHLERFVHKTRCTSTRLKVTLKLRAFREVYEYKPCREAHVAKSSSKNLDGKCIILNLNLYVSRLRITNIDDMSMYRGCTCAKLDVKCVC